jgi:hypothetical protein
MFGTASRIFDSGFPVWQYILGGAPALEIVIEPDLKSGVYDCNNPAVLHPFFKAGWIVQILIEILNVERGGVERRNPSIKWIRLVEFEMSFDLIGWAATAPERNDVGVGAAAPDVQDLVYERAHRRPILNPSGFSPSFPSNLPII